MTVRVWGVYLPIPDAVAWWLLDVGLVTTIYPNPTAGRVYGIERSKER